MKHMVCPQHKRSYCDVDGCPNCMAQLKRVCDTLRDWYTEFNRCERLGLPLPPALEDADFPPDPTLPSFERAVPWHVRARWWVLDRLDDIGLNIFEDPL